MWPNRGSIPTFYGGTEENHNMRKNDVRDEIRTQQHLNTNLDKLVWFRNVK
jgi:hypothetical protein